MRYAVRIVEHTQLGTVESEILCSDLVDANTRAKSEAYDTAEILIGDWQVQESMVDGRYRAKLFPIAGGETIEFTVVGGVA